VAMAAAGCAHCAHCAHLMVRYAADLASDQISRGVDPPRRSNENEDEWRRYLSAWTRAPDRAPDGYPHHSTRLGGGRGCGATLHGVRDLLCDVPSSWHTHCCGRGGHR